MEVSVTHGTWEGVIKYSGIGGSAVFTRSDPLYAHTMKRIKDAEEKAANHKKLQFDEAFEKAMMTRLFRMKSKEKIILALCLLYIHGYKDLAERYESKLLLNAFKGE